MPDVDRTIPLGESLSKWIDSVDREIRDIKESVSKVVEEFGPLLLDSVATAISRIDTASSISDDHQTRIVLLSERLAKLEEKVNSLIPPVVVEPPPPVVVEPPPPVVVEPPPPPPVLPEKEYIFKSTFESGSIDESSWILDVAPDKVFVLPEFEGKKDVVKFTLDVDQPRNSNGKMKSQMRLRDESVSSWKKTRSEPFLERRWYTFQTYIDLPSCPGRLHTFDIHGLEDAEERGIGRNPPLHLYYWNLNNGIQQNWSAIKTQVSNASLVTLWKDVAIQKKWVRWTIEAIWHWTDKGLLRVWRDDALIIDRPGLPNCYNDDEGPYLVLGPYLPVLNQSTYDTYRPQFPAKASYSEFYSDVRIGSGDVFQTKEEFLGA